MTHSFAKHVCFSRNLFRRFRYSKAESSGRVGWFNDSAFCCNKEASISLGWFLTSLEIKSPSLKTSLPKGDLPVLIKSNLILMGVIPVWTLHPVVQQPYLLSTAFPDDEIAINVSRRYNRCLKDQTPAHRGMQFVRTGQNGK